MSKRKFDMLSDVRTQTKSNKSNKNSAWKSSNIFMSLIHEKTEFSILHMFKYFAHKHKIKKFKKMLMETSPDFGLLWRESDFIKLAEQIFFYDNSNSDIGLYSSNSYAAGENGFKITEYNADGSKKLVISIKLVTDYTRVLVEASRCFGNNIVTSLCFDDGQWAFEPNIYDEMMLNEIIKIISTHIIMLFDYCYEMK